MNKFVAAGILVALCAVVLAGVLWHDIMRDFVTTTRTYANLQQARSQNAIAQGWLPDFLPDCATNIHEKHNFEQNTVIAAFSFDPAASVAAMLQKAEEMPVAALPTVNPARVGGRESWFPEAIYDGKYQELTPPSFRLYRVQRKAKVGGAEVLKAWHLALNQEAGTCYLWYFVRIAGGIPQGTSTAPSAATMKIESGGFSLDGLGALIEEKRTRRFGPAAAGDLPQRERGGEPLHCSSAPYMHHRILGILLIGVALATLIRPIAQYMPGWVSFALLVIGGRIAIYLSFGKSH